MSRIGNCRSCGSSKLEPVLDLGTTPLANSLLSQSQLGQSEPVFSLAVCFCEDCSLLQLYESVPPDDLFRNYAYFSSFSDTMLTHAKSLVGSLVAQACLNHSSLVVEVASNDGYLLQYYKELGVPVLGIEPARNIAEVAQEKGIETICEFFGQELATILADSGRKADVIHANNVLAHVPDLNGVVRGFATVLKDDGLVVVEVPYVRDLLDHTEFDTIYHEHLCYFSLTALVMLFKRNGLIICDVERLQIHGGSLRIYGRKHGRPSARVTEMLAAERAFGLDSLVAYEKFANQVQQLKTDLCSMLAGLKKEGKTIAAYGAAAKGSTLLNYAGIGLETLDFVCDRSTVKQGQYMPGVKLPIVSPSVLTERRPDYVLLLTWNFAKEIIAQQKEYLDLGGKFILPVPAPVILELMSDQNHLLRLVAIESSKPNELH